PRVPAEGAPVSLGGPLLPEPRDAAVACQHETRDVLRVTPVVTLEPNEASVGVRKDGLAVLPILMGPQSDEDHFGARPEDLLQRLAQPERGQRPPIREEEQLGPAR